MCLVLVVVSLVFFVFLSPKTNAHFPLSKSVTLQNFKGKQLYVLPFYLSVYFSQTTVMFAISVLYFSLL